MVLLVAEKQPWRKSEKKPWYPTEWNLGKKKKGNPEMRR
jgi:hypothetical protein